MLLNQPLMPTSHNPDQVLYHGTSHSFEQFSLDVLGQTTGRTNTQFGFFFTSDKEIAADFAQTVAGGDRVICAKVVIQKPVVLNIHSVFTYEEQAPSLWEIVNGERLEPSKALAALDEEINLGEFSDFLEAVASADGRAILERDGFDGVIGHMGGGILEYVAFKPDQIMIIGELSASEVLREADLNGMRYASRPSRPRICG